MFDHFDLPQPTLIFAISGILCLTLGRRSLSLTIALTGFYLGGRLAKVYWGVDSHFFIILFAAFAGVAGVVLSKLSKTAALNIVAFAIGGFVFSSYLVHWGMVAPQYEGVLFITFGLLSAIFSIVKFDLGLTTLSSLLGAALLAQASGTESITQAALFAGLALAGILIQTGVLSQGFDRSDLPPKSSKKY